MSDNRDDGKGSGRDPEKENEIRRSARRERAYQRLGTRNPRCIYCDETEPLVMEKHHIAGQAYDPDTTVITCRNCHRKLSDRQDDHPEQIAETPDGLEVVAHCLLGLADLFELLIGKFREFAALLIERADPNRENTEPSS
jgi:hypothetical protein